MIGRAALSLALGLLFATNAGAQLASQTALVGTVTDSGNLVIPGAQVVAVNVGTKDTYEATTNAEGYYNIQFVRTGKYETTHLTGLYVAGDASRAVQWVVVAAAEGAEAAFAINTDLLKEDLS